MSINVDIFLAYPIISDFKLPPPDPKRMRHVCRLDLVHGANDGEILEEAFRILNVAHPGDYNERSLSVGDIVTIAGKRSYRCGWSGWERLERPLLRQRNIRDALRRLMVRKRTPRFGMGRILCRLLGCAAAQTPACARCRSFIYDPDFLPPGRWLREVLDGARRLRRKCLHRCEVCRCRIWFSEWQCCSEQCFEQWLPF
jgi:hypothetical protein